MSETTVTMTTAEMANQLHAKVPEDHKPRKVDDKEAMALASEAQGLSGIVTVTVRGVTWDIDKSAFNDFRLMYQAHKGNIFPMIDTFVPSAEIMDKLLETCALPDGRVPPENVNTLFEEITAQVGMGK